MHINAILIKLAKGWKFTKPFLPLFMLATIGVLAAGLLVSCDGDKPRSLVGPLPNVQGVPVVRVKLGQPTAQLQLAVSGAHRIRCNGKVVNESIAALPYSPVSYTGNGWQIGGAHYAGQNLVVEPVAANCFYIGQVAYRGTLHLLPHDASAFIMVNHVDMESYLAGVVPKELILSWSLETYKALAVAARTFVMYHQHASPPQRAYDVGDGESSQVYGGYSAEALTPYARQAIEATRGLVLTYPQGGANRIFLAQYSACCGGTVNGAYVIRNAAMDTPIVGGQVCNDCRACARYRWPAVRVHRNELLAAVAARYPQAQGLGSLASLKVVSATPYGRAVWVDLIGTAGQTVRVRAEDIRLSYNMSLSGKPDASARRLYSMNCTIRMSGDYFEFSEGKGFGHGVGLCQWGAQGKAAAGWKAGQILGFYYPGTTITRMY